MLSLNANFKTTFYTKNQFVSFPKPTGVKTISTLDFSTPIIDVISLIFNQKHRHKTPKNLLSHYLKGKISIRNLINCHAS